MKRFFLLWLLVIVFFALMTTQAMSFEHTKVLPRGVRNLDLKFVSTSISEQTDSQGTPRALGEPLAQDLTFEKVLQEEEGLRQALLEAFLMYEGISGTDSLGQYTGDVRGKISVYAPILTWGVTDKVSIAIGVPFYEARTSLSVGFQPNENAENFLKLLSKPYHNQTVNAQEAADKLNHAVAFLNTKLMEYGYDELEDWEESGIGDLTIGARYRFLEMRRICGATTWGVVAPTGRTDDPDILNDIGFGDGTWDVFGQLTLDQPLGSWKFFVNEHIKYTYQFADHKEARIFTEEDPISDEKRRVYYKLGDKLDTGLSLQYEPSFGLLTGIGYNYFRKFSDRYHGAGIGKSTLEKNTEQEAHVAEAMIGYSTVQAFMDKKFAVPFMVTLGYKKQLASKNMPVSDLAEMDLHLFF